MNPLSNEKPTGMPSWYDPFQEIRTMPKGWDLSSILETDTASAKSGAINGDQEDQKSAKVNPPDLP